MLEMRPHDEAELGHYEALLDRIAQGDNVDGRDGEGCTPLMWAGGMGHYVCAQTLIEADAAVDKAINDGHTALINACNSGHHECAQALIDAHAAVDKVASGGWTALMLVSGFNSSSSPHVIEDTPQLASVRDLQTDAQGVFVNFAGDMLALAKLPKPRRRSRRLAVKC